MEVKTCQDMCDIIIVGAGLSGLTSALQILRKENTLQIQILEATNAMGGRLNQCRLGEIGGKWISEKQIHAYTLLRELKIPMRHRRIMSPFCAKRRWDIDMGLFAPLVKFELSRYIYELEIRVQFYRPEHYEPLRHEQTMHKHINNRLFFNKSRSFMQNFVLLTCGVSAREITYSQFLSNCYTCGGLRTLMDIYVFCPNTLLELPSSKLLNAFQEKLKSAEFHYQRKVSKVHQFKDHVEVYDTSNEVHKADVVIIAIPITDMMDITFSPPLPIDFPLPPNRNRRAENMFTSFIATYDNGYWREGGHSGNLLYNDPILFIGNEYRPNSYYGLLVHDEFIEPLIKSIALRMLADNFGEKMLSPSTYVQRSYGMNATSTPPITSPWKRVVFSSSCTAATCFRNCIGGAVQSGLRAAVNALLIIRPQAIYWTDIRDTQCENVVTCDVSWFELWRSTWNLYNVAWYGVIGIAILTLLRQMHIRYNKLN